MPTWVGSDLLAVENFAMRDRHRLATRSTRTLRRQVPALAGPTNVVCSERNGRSAGTSLRIASLPTAATSPPNVARPCSQSSPTVI